MVEEEEEEELRWYWRRIGRKGENYGGGVYVDDDNDDDKDDAEGETKGSRTGEDYVLYVEKANNESLYFAYTHWMN